MECKHNFRVSTGLGIIIGMLCLGFFVTRAVSNFKSYDRTVSVRGLSEREVDADKAIYPVAFMVSGNNLPDLYAAVEKNNKIILDFLADMGFEDNEISVSLPKVSDKELEGYTTRSLRYAVTSSITVYTTRVDKVIEMSARLNNLSNKGIALVVDVWPYIPQYLFEGLNAVKPSMIEEATANARDAAQKFADDSGSELGKIKTAVQGQFSITDRDANTPYIKKVRVVTNVVYYLKD